MTVLAGIAALIGTVSVQLVKLVVVDIPTALANGGSVVVSQMSK
jgi:hypothetical protein